MKIVSLIVVAVVACLAGGCDEKPNDAKFGSYVDKFYKDFDGRVNASLSGIATNKTHVLGYDLQKTNSVTSPYQYEVRLWREVSHRDTSENEYETARFGFKDDDFFYMSSVSTDQP